jgi:hypothetical protein
MAVSATAKVYQDEPRRDDATVRGLRPAGLQHAGPGVDAPPLWLLHVHPNVSTSIDHHSYCCTSDHRTRKIPRGDDHDEHLRCGDSKCRRARSASRSENALLISNVQLYLYPNDHSGGFHDHPHSTAYW